MALEITKKTTKVVFTVTAGNDITATGNAEINDANEVISINSCQVKYNNELIGDINAYAYANSVGTGLKYNINNFNASNIGYIATIVASLESDIIAQIAAS